MVKKYKYKKLTWIDVESPTNEEVRTLMGEYNIHPLAAEELLLPTTKSTVDVYGDHIYLSLHFPAWKHTHREVLQEIDFIIGKDYVLTTRYDSIDALHKFAKVFEVNSILEKSDMGKHAICVFFRLIETLYGSLNHELEFMSDVLTDIEKKVFNGEEKQMVYKLSQVSRELIGFKHATNGHIEMLTSFKNKSTKLFGSKWESNNDEMIDECKKVIRSIERQSESLYEIRETNNALLETKQSEIMLMFTSITIISSVVTIIASWFLIESTNTPFEGSPNKFWLVGLVMLIVAVGLAFVMRNKKWL